MIAFLANAFGLKPALQQLYDKFAQVGNVKPEYETKVYAGHFKRNFLHLP
jgi:hypothetical protein